MKTELKVAAIAIATVDGLIDANYARAGRLVEIALADAPDIVPLPVAWKQATGTQAGKPVWTEIRIDDVTLLFEVTPKGGKIVVKEQEL